MKFIKLFEQHNEYFKIINEDEFYGKISYDRGMVTSFTDTNKIYIQNRLNHNFVCEYSARNNGRNSTYNTLRITDSSFSFNESTEKKIEIWQLNDEWFIVSIFIKPGEEVDDIENYECDQMVGLLKLLKEKDIIK